MHQSAVQMGTGTLRLKWLPLSGAFGWKIHHKETFASPATNTKQILREKQYSRSK